MTKFSLRTNWQRSPNRLTGLLEAARADGSAVVDLTLSNPTQCGILYPDEMILAAVRQRAILRYEPDPRGIPTARKAVGEYYRERGITVGDDAILLTASTSEAYWIAFETLCDQGDAIAVPVPTYPLFEYLAQLSGVKTISYSLRNDGHWSIDLESLEAACREGVKALVFVHPHNPTGMFLKNDQFALIKKLASKYGIALIVDEVFRDYPLCEDATRVASTASEHEVLVFTLNGISKSIGLPQMKLGWIVVSGPDDLRREAMGRMEIVADSFLSVNAMVQHGLPELMQAGKRVREQIVDRVQTNLGVLQENLTGTPLTLRNPEGGWYACIKVPNTKSEDEWVESLLKERNILVHPGYFFDFADDRTLILSLLPKPENFLKGVNAMTQHIAELG